MPMPEPEHFAAVANRHLIRLREIPMTDHAPHPEAHLPTTDPAADHATHDPDGGCCDRGAAIAMSPPPSAADHYRQACHQLARADADAGHLPERSTWIDAARTHLLAADVALKLWPHRLADLQTVAEAAQDLVAAGPESTARAEAYDRLVQAVTWLEAAA